MWFGTQNKLCFNEVMTSVAFCCHSNYSHLQPTQTEKFNLSFDISSLIVQFTQNSIIIHCVFIQEPSIKLLEAAQSDKYRFGSTNYIKVTAFLHLCPLIGVTNWQSDWSRGSLRILTSQTWGETKGRQRVGHVTEKVRRVTVVEVLKWWSKQSQGGVEDGREGKKETWAETKGNWAGRWIHL